MPRPISPYHAPGFYETALARGQHRDIVGGRWEETGELQLELLKAEGLQPHHRLLDIGCGSLRAGCLLVPWLDPGNYWGTDRSAALMHRGYEVELDSETRDRLPLAQLIEDDDFGFAGVPRDFDFLLCFAVCTHLPPDHTGRALSRIATHFTGFQKLLLTVFLAPEDLVAQPLRQPDGVVTHPDRAPWHLTEAELHRLADNAGLTLEGRSNRLPRGQRLFVARHRA